MQVDTVQGRQWRDYYGVGNDLRRLDGVGVVTLLGIFRWTRVLRRVSLLMVWFRVVMVVVVVVRVMEEQLLRAT